MSDTISAVVERLATEENWNNRVSLIRAVPEEFGKAHHQSVYAAIADAIYVSELAPDFGYIHWRDDYELIQIEQAYVLAYRLTAGFTEVDIGSLSKAIEAEPVTVRIFRLLLGLTTQEFAAATVIPADEEEAKPLSIGRLKSIESGKRAKPAEAKLAAAVVDRMMIGSLFPKRSGDVRSKIDKPDTASGWTTVRDYAEENVPLPVFLHQRHYGGAFRQLLDATSGKRGNLIEDAVEELFASSRIPYVRTGPSTKELIAKRFGITVKPAPDFVLHDNSGLVRAILECKQANDGGTARDKAARFTALRNEAVRLGGIPVFAVLAGLGWRRTADTLGPVVRDTDGRVFTTKTLDQMITVEPMPGLVGTATDPQT